MIYLFYGNDIEKARQKANSVLDSLTKKRPDASISRVTAENWDESIFNEYIGSQGLFVQKNIIFFDRLFENKETKEFIIEHLKAIGSSENIFIILEGALDKASLAKLEKNSEKVQVFGEEKIKTTKPEFNMFAMTDALGARNQKRLWTLYEQAKRHDAVAEEIHGMIFWQIKSMLLSMHSKDAKEAGLNPFVFSKAKNYSKNFSEEELKKISSDLVTMYHMAHRGEVDFDCELEKFFLSV